MAIVVVKGLTNRHGLRMRYYELLNFKAVRQDVHCSSCQLDFLSLRFRVNFMGVWRTDRLTAGSIIGHSHTNNHRLVARRSCPLIGWCRWRKQTTSPWLRRLRHSSQHLQNVWVKILLALISSWFAVFVEMSFGSFDLSFPCSQERTPGMCCRLTGYYRAMLHSARHCHGKSSVRKSVRLSDAEVSWSYR